MDVFELFATIGLDTSDFDKSLSSVGDKLNSLSGKITSGIGGLAKNVTAAFMGAAKAAGDFTANAVEAGMAFDASMSNVAAISGATSSEFDQLREKAQEMGASTKFSASEAADAMGYMAMAGWKTQDMLSGIDGIMSLAAASGEDLATTSDIVTDALTAFGLTASDAGHFSDVLAAASSNANTNVTMLGESFKYVAPMAGALGYSVEDVATALGLMANAGIKSSQAGTSLRSLFNRMAKQPKEAAAAMAALGLSLEDGQGNMLSLKEVMGDIRNAFKNDLQIPAEELQQEMDKLDQAYASKQITKKQYEKEMDLLNQRAFGAEGALKAQYAAMLAGTTGMSGLLAIINASDEDYQKLTDSIYDCNGAAEKMAATMQDNLQGDITIMKSAFEGLQIAISDKVTPALRKFTKFGSNILSDLTAAIKKDGFKGVLTYLKDLFTKKIPESIKRWLTSMGANWLYNAFSALSDTFNNLINGIGTAVAWFKDKLTDFSQSEKFTIFMYRLREISEVFTSDRVAKVFEGIGLALLKIAEAFMDFMNSDLVLNFFKGLGDLIDKLGAEGIADLLFNLAKGMLAVVAVSKFVGLIKGIGSAFKFMCDTISMVKTAGAHVIEFAKGVPAALSGIGSKISGAVSGMAGVLKDLPSLMTMDVNTLFGAGTGAEIGTALGVSIAAGIVAAIAGAELGKAIGAMIFPEDAELYEHYAGISGTFLLLKDTIEGLFDPTFWDSIFKDPLQEELEFLRSKNLDFTPKIKEEVRQDLMNSGSTDVAGYVDRRYREMHEEAAGIIAKINQDLRAIGESTINLDDFLSEYYTDFKLDKNKLADLEEQINGYYEALSKTRPSLEKAAEKAAEKTGSGKTPWSVLQEINTEGIDGATESIDKLGEATEETAAATQDLWDGLENIDPTQLSYDDFLAKIQEHVGDDVAGEFNDMGKSIANGVADGMIQYDITDAINKWYEEIKNGIKTVFGMDPVATSMYEDGENIAKGLVEGIANADTESSLQTWWETLKASLDSMCEETVATFQTWSETISGVFTDLSTTLDNTWNDMKAAIEEAFAWLQENFKLPHISIEGDWDFQNGQVPDFKVDWYAKAMDNPMVLNSPTIFGAAGGRYLGAGEAGSEVVSGSATLMNMISNAVAASKPENLTVVLELDKRELARTVYDLNLAESKRVGVRLANV